MGEPGILGTAWDCECGRTHEVPTKLALIEPGAIGRTGEVLRNLGLKGRVLIIVDSVTRDVAGKDVAAVLKRDGFDSRTFIVPGEKPRADDKTAELAAAAVEKGDAIIVSVGSGTVTDLSKWAAFKANLPHVAVATAPSMNGYASGIVALTVAGLKTTNSVLPPIAVVADLDILCAAPIEMIRAGLGDLISKPVCNADWKVASILKGEHFCPRPFDIVRELEPLYMEGAAGIAKRERSAVAPLMEALVLSGVSMVIAGSSAPASGGEHLISHFIDMRADAQGRDPSASSGHGHDLHGAQVGVATLATARLYERLMALDANAIDPRAIESVWERGEALASRTAEIFGGRSSAILAEFKKKRGTRGECEALAQAVAERWDGIRREVRPFLIPSSQMRAALDLAGAKVHYGDIGVSASEFRDALELALTIRSRFTVLDMAFTVGELDKWADEMTGMA